METTVLINTQQGKKTPEAAFVYFQKSDCSVPNKIAILGQLNSSAPFFAHEAAALIKREERLGGEAKLQRVADEILSGLPMGEKRFVDAAGYSSFFGKVPTGSRIQITFAENKIEEVRAVLSLRNYLTIDPDAQMFITNCVLPSGRWEGISRTCGARFHPRSPADIEMTAHYLSACIESVKLLYSPEQLQQALTGGVSPSKKRLDELMSRYSRVDYDITLFNETVDVLGYPKAKEWTKSFASDESLETILAKFNSDFARLEFFRTYALKYEVLLAS